MFKIKSPFGIGILLMNFVFLCVGCQADQADNMPSGARAKENFRVLTDMRNQEVKIPRRIERAVVISDGLIESVMYRLGVVDKIVGLGSRCVKNIFEYNYVSAEGGEYVYKNGMNPVTYLYPELKNLPLVAASNLALNYETLVSLQPDVVLLRAGSCTFGTLEDENTQKTVRMLESIGIPLIVLKGPPCYDQPVLDSVSAEIELIGRLFGKEKEARRLATFLEEQSQEIKKRTIARPESEKKRILLLGLSPRVRASGGAGNTKGKDTIESFFIEQMIHARNAYQGFGGRSSYLVLSAEQIYALDPDVILLPTSSGYHPPRELYTAPYFQNLRQLRAVKEQKVFALPWTPCNCAKRIEFPIELMIMAKAAYPERFVDFKVHDWALDFYMAIYGVDREVARKLLSVQWLDWMIEDGF